MTGILQIIDEIGLSVILTFLIVLFTVYYIYSTWDWDYWSKQGIPGETPWPIVGTFKPELLYTRFEQVDFRRHKTYGRVHGGFEGHLKALYITDPELIKQVMVKDFPTFTNRRQIRGFDSDPVLAKSLTTLRGEEWKNTRAVISPTFTTGKIKHMVYLVEESAKKMVKYLDKFAETKEPVDLKKCLSAFSLDVIANCAFGMKVDCLENPDNEFLQKAQKNFQAPALVIYLLLIFPKLFLVIGKPLSRLTGNPFQYFKDVAGNMIDMRSKEKLRSQKDFLDLMLEAQQEENSESTENEGNAVPKGKKILTRNAMISQSIIFLLAGFETTASTLSLVVYCLAQNADVQNKLIREIDDVMTDCKGNLTYDIVMNLQYMDMVVSETLRLYPPGSRVERACGVDNYKLGKATLNKEDLVVVSVYALHKDPEFFPNPEKFDPERFSPENKESINQYTYIPFGIGPRNCIAKRFALIEVKLALAHLLFNFRFNTCEKTEFPMNFNANGGLLSPKTLTLQVQKRTDQPHFDRRADDFESNY